MNRFVVVAPLLLAAAAYEKVSNLLAPPVATLTIPTTTRPAAASASSSRLGAMGARGTTGTADVAAVVTAANAFLATLSDAQRATVLQGYTQANVVRWSNFPIAGYNQRLGLRLDALTAPQQAAALAVVQAATGTTSNEGFNEIQQIRAADDYLVSTGSNSAIFGSGIYFIAFLGTPSTTGTWMLQCGGHHSATNITFAGGAVTGATPKFEGVEPLSFTAPNANVLPTGVTYAPQAQEQAGMLALISSLTAAQQAAAKLTQTFNDVVVGPQKDGQFPATRVGLPGSQLTSAQQQLVVDAMAPWVKDADDATAANLLAIYQKQLADTYIAYAGTGNLATTSDYVRIDGPNVWIELVVQRGAEFPTQIHYHTIYRDRARDYGGNFYTTVTLGTKAAAAAQTFAVYPNPADQGSSLRVELRGPATSAAASYTLRNALGQPLVTQQFRGRTVEVPTHGLPAGTYLLSLHVEGQASVTHRFSVR